MSTNFGLGNRNMALAGKNALYSEYKAHSISSSCRDSYVGKWSNFCEFAKAQGVNKMEKITAQTVFNYVENLKERDLSLSTIKTSLSAINNVMGQATKGAWIAIQGGKDLGLDHRSQVRTTATPTREAYDRALDILKVEPRAQAVLQLAREFGLREKEASLLNSKTALRQFERTGSIRVEVGTKGGRPREIPITNERQVEALRFAASFQGRNKSLVPAEKSYKQFANSTIKHIRSALREAGAGRIHDQRASYAAERYEQITGHSASCNSSTGHREVSKEADREARMTISQELGHARVDVTVSYLGSMK